MRRVPQGHDLQFYYVKLTPGESIKIFNEPGRIYYENNEPDNMVHHTTENIIKDLIRVKENLNRIPTKELYTKHGSMGLATVCRRFGTWNKALKEVFGSINKEFHGVTEGPCAFCGKKTRRQMSHLKKIKNIFCTRSCAASFNNKLKRKSRRSKCEKMLFDLLCKEFPKLNILNNDKIMLKGLEADIAIPSLNLAIEWNGIVHYKPIYGQKKLTNVQNLDKKKIQLANQLNIHLIVVPDLVSDKKTVYRAFHDICKIINNLK